MATFRVRHLLECFGQLWLQSFRRAVVIVVIGIIVASVRVSFSQINGSGEGSGFTTTQPDDIDMNSIGNSTANRSSVEASCRNSNMQCKDLPAICLDCNFNDSKNCEYGRNTSVSCVPLPRVDCQVGPLRKNPLFPVTRLCLHREASRVV